MSSERSDERRHARRQPPERPFVLIVDGDADSRELYSVALPSFSFETDAIDDIAGAYDRAWRTHPDVIVAEMSRAGDVAWEVIQHLKRDPRTGEIPIVIVTSQGQPALRERAAREGCAAFLLKPCLPEDLAITLRDVLDNRSHERIQAAY